MHCQATISLSLFCSLRYDTDHAHTLHIQEGRFVQVHTYICLALTNVFDYQLHRNDAQFIQNVIISLKK